MLALSHQEYLSILFKNCILLQAGSGPHDWHPWYTAYESCSAALASLLINAATRDCVKPLKSLRRSLCYIMYTQCVSQKTAGPHAIPVQFVLGRDLSLIHRIVSFRQLT